MTEIHVKHNLSYKTSLFFCIIYHHNITCTNIDNLADDDDDENYDEKCRNMCTLFI